MAAIEGHYDEPLPLIAALYVCHWHFAASGLIYWPARLKLGIVDCAHRVPPQGENSSLRIWQHRNEQRPLK
jgi:hypothetical protein